MLYRSQMTSTVWPPTLCVFMCILCVNVCILLYACVWLCLCAFILHVWWRWFEEIIACCLVSYDWQASASLWVCLCCAAWAAGRWSSISVSSASMLWFAASSDRFHFKKQMVQRKGSRWPLIDLLVHRGLQVVVAAPSHALFRMDASVVIAVLSFPFQE